MSIIATTAAGMSTGSFAQIANGSMNGWLDGGHGGGHILAPLQGGCGSGDYLTQYMSKGWWNAEDRTAGFIGVAHGNCWAGEFVVFDDATDTWSYEDWPNETRYIVESIGHAYHHNTGDPVTAIRYYRHHASYRMYKLTGIGNGWVRIADSTAPGQGGAMLGNAIEYHGAAGRLIHIEGDWGVRSWNPATDTWSVIANTNVNVGGPVTLGTYSHGVIALYSPTHQIMLVGENSNLYKLAANGTTFTAIADPPFDLGSYSDSGNPTRGIAFVEPVTGDFMALSDTGDLYVYDVDADSWSDTGLDAPAVLDDGIGVGDGMVLIPISTYGVTMLIKYSGPSSQAVYLLKWAESEPEPQAPSRLVMVRN